MQIAHLQVSKHSNMQKLFFQQVIAMEKEYWKNSGSYAKSVVFQENSNQRLLKSFK